MKPQKTAREAPLGEQRLHKVLAAAGVCARRKCEELICAGHVSVDGKVVKDLGFKVHPTQARIEVRGKRVQVGAERVYYLVNKPRGVVSTCSDPEGRPTVGDLIPDCKERVFPVGRLDTDSQGLVLLTNDGEVANILTHPRFQVEKEYLVKVRGIPTEKTLQRAMGGVRLEDGQARAKEVEVDSKTASNAWIRVVLCEGRNRVLKRMFQALGHPVMKLRRIRLFYFKLGKLPEGAAVALSAAEAEMLRRKCLKLTGASTDIEQRTVNRSKAAVPHKRSAAPETKKPRKRTRRAQ
ncbi:MAG TPA: pseudouridine synthase [bacterium]|nr:pseudouridine synthase [bacterium]